MLGIVLVAEQLLDSQDLISTELDGTEFMEDRPPLLNLATKQIFPIRHAIKTYRGVEV
jgi:hypothetical protein